LTCIAAVTDGKTVWMGGDSAGIGGWELTVRADPKVFRVGELAIGITDSFRMGNLLRFRLAVPAIPDDGDLFEWASTAFIDAVRDCLKAGGHAERDKEREAGGTFLVGVRGRLFQVNTDYQVGEAADGYDAVGCGHAYAKGAMHALGPLSVTLSPTEKVRRALEAAERHSAGVRGPFTILSSGMAD
jgi:ATP-dependent protease HslVU (ClpYQ) peptidase subunit